MVGAEGGPHGEVVATAGHRSGHDAEEAHRRQPQGAQCRRARRRVSSRSMRSERRDDGAPCSGEIFEGRLRCPGRDGRVPRVKRLCVRRRPSEVSRRHSRVMTKKAVEAKAPDWRMRTLVGRRRPNLPIESVQILTSDSPYGLSTTRWPGPTRTRRRLIVKPPSIVVSPPRCRAA
jgi:hypothetical protein